MLSTLAAGFLVASIATTLAAPQAQPGKGVKINQVSVGKQWRSGPVAVQQTYEKFGVAVPDNVKSAAASAQQGKATATPEQYDSQYLVPVTVGEQTLNLDFDTGSSDLWVFSTLQPSSQSQGHTVYNPSSGTKESGETWQIQYEDGSGSAGVVYADTVVVGGVTATSQAVEAATSASTQFQENTSNDGLLGLGFPNINTCTPKKCSPYFNTVESSLTSPVFTADLKHGEPGSYTFGYIDSTLYTGSITNVSVDSSAGYWGFTAGGYSVGSKTSTSGSIGAAIADTGTTLFYLPAAVAKAYWSKVSGAKKNAALGGYVFPCSKASSLPNFNVAIGGAVFTVPGAFMNFAPANTAGTQCYGGIQANTGLPFSIFGDIFLKSVYVVFQPETPEIGFAAQS